MINNKIPNAIGKNDIKYVPRFVAPELPSISESSNITQREKKIMPAKISKYPIMIKNVLKFFIAN